MRALILDGGLLGRPSQPTDPALLRVGSGETVFGRQVRLLAGRGVTEILVVGTWDEDARGEAARPYQTRVAVRFAHPGPEPGWTQPAGSGRPVGEDAVLVIADDLVFTDEVLELVAADPHGDVALYDPAAGDGTRLDPGSAGRFGSGSLAAPAPDALKALVRDGALARITGASGVGNAACWPVLKLSAPVAAQWLTQLTTAAADDPAPAITALNRVAKQSRIAVADLAGRWIDRAVDTPDFAETIRQARAADLAAQRTICETRGYVHLGREFARHGMSRVLLVADAGFDQLELADYLARLGVELVRFDSFATVPDWQDVVAAVTTFRHHDCDGVLTVGDEAAISVGKLVKLLADGPGLSVPPNTGAGFSATPHLVVATPGSLGAESTSFAVVRTPQGLRQVWQDCLLPEVAVLDSTVWSAASSYQRRSAMLGALARAIEAAWLPTATDESTAYALEALGLLARRLFDAIRKPGPATDRDVLKAANLAGRAISLTGPGVVGLLSHDVAQRLGIARGHATALCLPPVWRSLLAGLPGADVGPAARFRAASDRIAARLAAATPEAAVARLEWVARLLDGHAPNADPDRDPVDPPAAGEDDLACLATGASPLPLTEAQLAEARRSALVAGTRVPPERPDLEVLVRFDAFCRARNVAYFLFGRTLLDAVTVGELTPWSGPITLAMHRRAYDKLARWRDQLPPALWLDDLAGNPARGSLAPRVVLSGGERPEHPDALPGITIRVLDSVNEGFAPSQLVRRGVLRLLHRMTLASEAPAASGGPIERLGARLGPARLERLRLRYTRRGRRRPGVHSYVDPGLGGGFAGFRFQAEWFGKDHHETLNGRQFRAPVRPDAVLAALFGKSYRGLRSVPEKPRRRAAAASPATAVPPSTAVAPAGTTAPARSSGDAPLLSIIVPVYNVERYLAQCLDSLCQQDTGGYEVIAVDDGSPDGSLEILRDYERRFPDLLRVVSKPNGGLSDARNFGLGLARGSYVGFVDSDDFVSTSLVRLMTAKALAGDADIVVCNHAEYWAEENRADVRWMSFINSYGHPVSERPELLVAAHPYAWNKIYRRRLFDDYEIRYPKGQAFEDSATTFNLMLHANRIEYVDEALYFYRMDRPDSITNTFNEKFYDIFKSFDSLQGFYRRYGRLEEFREEINELMRRTSFARVNALETCRDPEAVAAFLTAVYDYLDRHGPGWAQNRYFRRQMENPKYGEHPKYRAMHSRTLMLDYFRNLWKIQGDDLALAAGHSTAELIGRLQQEELDILLEIDRFCTDRGLTYYLAEGTLLGAVRHQGFIPWDDDIDIVMPRADYEVFLAALADGQEPGLRLFHESTYRRYHLTFAKVLSTSPSGFTNTNIPVPVEFQGPCVDVFPLDRAPVRRDRPTERRVRLLRDLLLFKVGYMSERTKRARYGTYLLSTVVGFGYLQRRIQRYYRRHENDPKATCLVNYASSYPVDREKTAATNYGEPVRIPFEGHLLPVPANWDAVLRTTYGAYMELPPEHARRPRHRPRWRELSDAAPAVAGSAGEEPAQAAQAGPAPQHSEVS